MEHAQKVYDEIKEGKGIATKDTPKTDAPKKTALAATKEEPKADPKTEAKPEAPKVAVSMDDAVIAGIPAQHDGLAKKSAVKSAPAAKAVAMK